VVVQHHIPWLAPCVDSCGGTVINTERNRGKIQNKTLTSGSEEVILKHNALDEYVFQFGLTLFEERLAIAKNVSSLAIAKRMAHYWFHKEPNTNKGKENNTKGKSNNRKIFEQLILYSTTMLKSAT
jgi:hypothetical protein